MDYTKLGQLVNATPAALEAFNAGDDKAVAAILNAETDREDAAYKVTWNDFFKLFGADRGNEILTKIKALAAHATLYDIMRPSEGGIDVSISGFGAIANTWRTSNAMTPAEVSQLSDLVKKPTSPANKLRLGTIGDGHIQSLREIKKESRS